MVGVRHANSHTLFVTHIGSQTLIFYFYIYLYTGRGHDDEDTDHIGQPNTKPDREAGSTVR